MVSRGNPGRVPPRGVDLVNMAMSLWIRKVRLEHKTCVISLPAELVAVMGIRQGGWVRLELGVVAGGVVIRSVEEAGASVLEEVVG